MSEAGVPPVPGEVLKELFPKLLPDRQLTQVQFARMLGMSKPHLNMILSGRCRVSAEVALRIERVFGIRAEFWMRLTSELKLFEERQRLSEELSALSPAQPQKAALSMPESVSGEDRGHASNAQVVLASAAQS
jgi:HTH-type transcriptional regulator/antitoxin HigA